MKRYLAFKCGACGLINVINKQYADGHRCKECKGFLNHIGEAVVDNKSLNIDVGVDTAELDKALRKATRLHNELTTVELKMIKLRDMING